MGAFGVGQPVRRREDVRFVTGAGCYLDDMDEVGLLHAAFVRAPLAHADIGAIDTAPARRMPGVRAVLTGADLEAAGLGDLPCLSKVASVEPPRGPRRRPLAVGRVRHVGEPVAVVIGETATAVRDAAEAVDVVYTPLPAVAEATAALAADAPQLNPDIPGNRAFRYEKGDAAAVDAAFAAAAHTVRVELVNNRVVVAAMEPRGCIARYEAADDRYLLQVSGQNVHGLRGQLATHILKHPVERVDVAAPDVGGGFGMKNFMYPEYPTLLWAARQVGAPVKWVADRTESFLTDTQGRDNVTTVEGAFDADHRVLGLRVRTIANLGAYLSTNGPHIPCNSPTTVMGGPYRWPCMRLEVDGALTNTAPIDAYRGAGRPETAYLLERLMDAAARQFGIDPAEVRRRNMIPPEALPHTNPFGITIDCGDFAGTLYRALARADRDGVPARKAASLAAGRLRGLGIGYYVEATLGLPNETMTLLFQEDGRVRLIAGTHSTGQGHETAYAQLLADRLGLDPGAVEMVQADTRVVATGAGHGGSRSMALGGSALVRTIERVIEKGRLVAGDLLEAAAADIAFDAPAAAFSVVGTDRSVPLHAVAEAARDPRFHEVVGPDGLDTAGTYSREALNFPNGAHIAEVEVDPETGVVTVDRYTAVDDFGTVINPLLAAGQVHGGVAQGVGQALVERTVYAEDDGQMLSGSFLDYAVPRADHLPALDVSFHGIPTQTNPLGVKGSGEAGCSGASPAVITAILDALAPLGVHSLDMPATPQAVWRALREAGTAAGR